MWIVCSSGDVQTKFYLLPRFLKHVSCYSFNGWCDPVLQVLDIPYLLSMHNVLNVPPQEKIKWREIRAFRWPGYWSTLSIQASGNLSFKTSVTKQLKWGGAPSCIKITLLTILFEGFNLWKHVLFKEMERDNPVPLFRWSCILKKVPILFFLNTCVWHLRIEWKWRFVFCSFELGCRVSWYVVTDVSGESALCIFKKKVWKVVLCSGTAITNTDHVTSHVGKAQ